jgi:GAF domain-containing protein
MVNPAALLEQLAGFAATVAREADVTRVMHDLTERVTQLLGATGTGASLVRDMTLVFAASSTSAVADVEHVQEIDQAGPGLDALSREKAVTIRDLQAPDVTVRWPKYAAAGADAGVRAAVAIPMQAAGVVVAVLGVYDAAPREWSSSDVQAVQILSGMAAGLVLQAGELEHERRRAEQLQQALDSRVVIEQAKGMLAGANGVSVDDAFQLLRSYSREHNAKLHDVATAVVHLGLRP